jgi:cobalt-zinc-cadmium efflux system outer membrane protein
LVTLALTFVIAHASLPATAQAQSLAQLNVFTNDNLANITAGDHLPQGERATLSRYYDQTSGMTLDQVVARTLEHNGELLAARAEVEAARARLRQAGLRPNPRFDVSRTEQVDGADNRTMIGGMLPLELGGRRQARIHVAEREVAMREQMLLDRARLLAAEARAKYGTALAEVRKLAFLEEVLAMTRQSYALVDARVSEGRTAPLERNMVLVEINRIRAEREGRQSKVEMALLELRNMMGMKPEEPLRLGGDLAEALPLPALAEATERALRDRPDLRAARAAEELAAAQIELARAEGRFNASLVAQYERMNFGFPVRGINDAGQLAPVQGIFHYATFGVSLDVPARNRNQGAVEAAVAEAEAARRRREFAELTVRREVAAAYAHYERAARAAEIFRTGVRDEARANLSVIRQTYELGSKALLDYIAEQRRFVEVETGYVDALLETYLARVEVERVIAANPQVSR